MSVEIKWETITSGRDGETLAETIRAFIHQKFQQTPLPRFINSVHVHSFEFGNVAPAIEIKDICDPLPDFYEDDESDEDEEGSDEHSDKRPAGPTARVDQDHLRLLQEQIMQGSKERASKSSFPEISRFEPGLSGSVDHLAGQFPRSSTPGIPGGTSNLNYFHLPIGGPSGIRTPLAAVASGTSMSSGLRHHDQLHQLGQPFQPSGLGEAAQRTADWRNSHSRSRPSTSSSIASPPDLEIPYGPRSPERDSGTFLNAVKVSDDLDTDHPLHTPPLAAQQSQPSDIQVVARVRYSGNVKMLLTAEILLDYPMPSFVGIPLKLSITGVTFDGTAILAYIRKKMHFCFLSPEDANAFAGEQSAEASEDAPSPSTPSHHHSSLSTSLLREIHVESEIGRKENGKQVLKNVGKVEKFVLEQVRRIFEEELVFPSFWTFLV